MRHAFLAAAVLLLAACDGPLFGAELQIPAIRVTLPEQQFPASDTSVPADWCDPADLGDPPCVARSLDYDLGGQVPILNEENVTYDLRLTDVALTLSTSGAGDLSGVRTLDIRILEDAALGTEGVLVASYVRPPGAVTPDTVAVTGNANVDLGPYLDAGRLPVRVEIVLDHMTPAFVADVQVGFSLEVGVDYGGFL